MSRSLYARLHRRFGPKTDPITRREMLRLTAASAAGLLLSGHAYGMPHRSAEGGKRVVVVGAGFGGLACAHELRSAGYDVTVIEARERIGGRVLSFADFIPGRNVEGGGELIGSNHPTWVAYKEKFGLEFLDIVESEDLAYPIVLGGERLDDEAAEALWEEMDAALGRMNADAEPIEADQPWESPEAARLDQRPTSDWISKLDCSDLCKRAIRAQLTNDNAVDVEKQSYLGNLTAVKGGGLERYWTDSEVYRCKGGNQQLAARLAEAIGADRIVLKLAVKEIKLSSSGARVACADGRTLEVDDVVLACPPPTWSKISIAPPLPRSLTPQMGVAVKYLTHVKTRFWKELGLAPDLATDGDIGYTWESTDAQPGDENAGLTAFSGGPSADRCRSRPAEPRDAAYREQIEKVYTGFADNLVAKRFMDWPGEALTGGSYTFPAPGEITAMGPTLRKGLGRLHFAGEHACYKFVGYMEGALNSGVSLAKRIAQRDRAGA